MVHYPNCPYCGNSTSALSVVDVEIDGYKLKAIQCNGCEKYFGFFQDHTKDIQKINEQLDDISSAIDDIMR